MPEGLRRLLISVTVLTIIFYGIGMTWLEIYVTIMCIGIIMLVMRTIFDFGKAVGNALHRDQYNFNLTEQHTHERHPDPTRPREDFPAVIEIERQITRRVK